MGTIIDLKVDMNSVADLGSFVKNQDPDPEWTTRIIFPRALKTMFWVKYLNSLMRSPGSGMEKNRIRDSGWKKSDPASGINIPDPQHWAELLPAPLKPLTCAASAAQLARPRPRPPFPPHFFGIRPSVVFIYILRRSGPAPHPRSSSYLSFSSRFCASPGSPLPEGAFLPPLVISFSFSRLQWY
jgi:hypothetical protein